MRLEPARPHTEPTPPRADDVRERLRGPSIPPLLLQDASVDRRWRPVTPWRAADAETGDLPDALRSWPPRWRYRVAELEALGRSRTEAMDAARREAAGLGARAA